MAADVLEPLLRPLRFAARRDFANLSKIKGLEASLARALADAALKVPAPLAEAARGLIQGLDGLDLADRRARIQALLDLLGAPVQASAAPRSVPQARPATSSPRVVPASAPAPARAAPAPASAPAPARPAALSLSPPVQPGPDLAPARLKRAAPKAAVRSTGKRIPMAEAQPGTPLAEVVGVGPKTAERLAQRGLETVQDALFFLPRKYEDRSRYCPIGELRAGERVSVQGEVRIARVRPAGRGKRVFELVIADPTGTLNCRFFRFYQSQMESRYPQGTQVVVSGPVTQWGAMRQMVHPEVEVVGEEGSEPEGVVPVYGDLEGVPAKKLRGILTGLASAAGHLVQDPLPQALILRHKLPRLPEAIVQAHLPSPGDLSLAPGQGEPALNMRRRLVFDELFYFQLALARTRSRREAKPGLTHRPSTSWPELARRMLPFALTGAQTRALGAIASDLAAPIPMNRLLQGDVGSGKTAVAFVAMAIVHASGRQSALLAPTEILAEQHFAKAQALMGPLGIRVALLTGSTKASERRWLLSQLRAGALHVLIGTHAIVEPTVVFKDLGLSIVDEQHRFGVEQRAALQDKGREVGPDVLVMTATPIPRTLALTAYGDLRVTIIDELPPGRSPTQTRVFQPQARGGALEGLRAELAAGRQAYVVFPLIEASEKLDLKAATEEVKALQEDLPGVAVALLHGRMRPDEKAEIMQRFTEGQVQVLVSTTVIEVGIDVPNATVMMIENAERFGLSQLHQLRGRVGRGQHRGHCFLMAGSQGAEAMQRLSVLEASHDGFVVAERDLELRGPGEVLGTRQSGLPDLVLADLVRDAQTVQDARDEAFAILEADPDLQAEPHQALAKELLRRFEGRTDLAGIG